MKLVSARKAAAVAACAGCVCVATVVAQQGQVDPSVPANGITIDRNTERPERPGEQPIAVRAATTLPDNIVVTDGDGNLLDAAARGIAEPITYQGRLRDGGLPANGLYPITIRVYDAEFAGNLLVSNVAGAWPVTNGVFTFPVSALGHFDGADRWLQIEVDGNILTPRQKLTPAPYSLKADSLQWPVVETIDDPFFAFATSNVFDAAHFIYGPGNNQGWLGSILAGAEGRSDDAIGVLGRSTNGIAVDAERFAFTGTDPAIYGRTNSESSFANAIVGEVLATSPGSSSTAVRGINNGTGGSGIGVWGSQNGLGWGVYGSTVNGTAIRATTNSAGGSLFFGTQAGTTCDVGGHVNGSGAVGLYVSENQISSVDSAAIYAVHNAAGDDDAKAIWGINNDTDFYGIGVRGEGGYMGTQGYAYGTGTGVYYGVYGDTSAGTGGVCYSVYGASPGLAGTRYAGYFAGNTHVSGTLSKAAGSFKIDHPLDPYNKFLYHSFVESPEMKNIYDGTVVLNAQGMARIEMPDYFESLNREFRYQLTAIGASMPNLYVASEIQNGAFLVAGGVPGAKVSWQVTGVRQDAYANQNRIPVEEWKTGRELGKLLHPTAFGRSAEEGIDRSRELEEAAKEAGAH